MWRRTPRASGLLVSCQLGAPVAALLDNTRPQFPHLENGFGLLDTFLAAQCWLVEEQSEQLQDWAWETAPSVI